MLAPSVHTNLRAVPQPRSSDHALFTRTGALPRFTWRALADLGQRSAVHRWRGAHGRGSSPALLVVHALVGSRDEVFERRPLTDVEQRNAEADRQPVGADRW